MWTNVFNGETHCTEAWVIWILVTVKTCGNEMCKQSKVDDSVGRAWRDHESENALIIAFFFFFREGGLLFMV